MRRLGLDREKRCAIAVGVDGPERRANLIEGGFADTLFSQVALVELAARTLNLDGVNEKIPQHCIVGPVRLDLFYRDANIDEKWIGLHPRQFALMWWLADVPGQRVGKAELLSDVWRLRHDPEAN